MLQIPLSLPQGNRLRGYVLAVLLAGGVAIALALTVAGAGSGDVGLVVGLILAGATAERFKVGLFGDSHVSLGAVACMVAAVVGGPRDVVLVAPPVALACNLKEGLPLYKTLFNIAVYVLAALAFGAVFDALQSAPTAASWPEVLLPATLAAAAYYVVNAALVTGAVGLASHRDLREVAGEKYLWLAPHYLPLGAVAAGLASTSGMLGAWAILLFALPLASTQVALYQYSSRREAEVARLRRACLRIRELEAELARVQPFGPAAHAA